LGQAFSDREHPAALLLRAGTNAPGDVPKTCQAQKQNSYKINVLQMWCGET
jgi:hypothetical protein